MKRVSPLHLLALAPAALAIGPQRPPPPPEVTLAKNFAWSDPWSANSSFLLEGLEAACTAEREFTGGAKLFLLHDLFESYPLGLAPWADALKLFFKGREYPGEFDGWDHHLHDRELVLMPYLEIPRRVREWIAEQDKTDGPGKGLFAVYDLPDDAEATKDPKVKKTKVKGPAAEIPEELELHRRRIEEHRIAIFAPGALYSILPLWVAEGSDCEGQFRCNRKARPSHPHASLATSHGGGPVGGPRRATVC
jgi:hypothetical protein